MCVPFWLEGSNKSIKGKRGQAGERQRNACVFLPLPNLCFQSRWLGFGGGAIPSLLPHHCKTQTHSLGWTISLQRALSQCRERIVGRSGFQSPLGCNNCCDDNRGRGEFSSAPSRTGGGASARMKQIEPYSPASVLSRGEETCIAPSLQLVGSCCIVGGMCGPILARCFFFELTMNSLWRNIQLPETVTFHFFKRRFLDLMPEFVA